MDIPYVCPCCGTNGVYTAHWDSGNIIVCASCAQIGSQLGLTGFHHIERYLQADGGWRTHFADSVRKTKEHLATEREKSAAAANAMMPHICACCSAVRPNIDKISSRERFICSDCWLYAGSRGGWGPSFACEIYLSNGYVVTSAALRALVEHREQPDRRVAEGQSAAPAAASENISKMPSKEESPLSRWIQYICACCGTYGSYLPATVDSCPIVCCDCARIGHEHDLPGFRQMPATLTGGGWATTVTSSTAIIRELLKKTPAAPAEAPPTEQRPQWNFCEGEIAWTISSSPTAPSRAAGASKKVPSSSPRERLAWALFCTLVEEDAEVVARCEIAPDASEKERIDRIKTVADRLWNAQPPHRLRVRAQKLAEGAIRATWRRLDSR